MRDGWSELGFPDGDPGLLLDLEPGLADGRTSVAAAVAAADQGRVERGVQEPFQPGERRLVRDHVLEVPELTAGAQHAADFAERGPLIWHRAQHKAGDQRRPASVAGCAGEVSSMCSAAVVALIAAARSSARAATGPAGEPVPETALANTLSMALRPLATCR
jgi:hypothetical protein